MKKIRSEPSQAKSMVMQQKYRSKQYKALKGKGSYSRKAPRNGSGLDCIERFYTTIYHAIY